jgi:hypothetical protein
MSRCRSCSAPIFWALTRKPNGDVGTRMPVDRDPVADGNIEIVDRTRLPEENDWTPVIRVLKKGDGDTLFEPPDRYVSHFATCPNAPQHRRKKSG